MWVSLRELEIIPGFKLGHVTEINSKLKSRFLFSLKVDVVIGYIKWVEKF